MFTQLYRQPARIVLLLVGMMTFLLASGVAAQPPAPPPPANQIEFIGVVQAMTMDTLQINNQIINISRAQIKTPIQVGQPLKIEGRLLADGSIIAREVKAVEDDDDSVLPGEFEIVGILTGMDAGTVTIGTQVIQIAGAELYPGLALGSVIKVKALLDPASAQWTAREVRPADFDDDDNGNDNFDDNGNDNADDNGNDNDDSDDDTFKLIGTLEEIGEGYIVIGGRRINTINARFSHRLVLGARAEVRLRTSDGELVARRIRLVQRAGDDDRRNIVLPANCVPVQPAGWTSYTARPGDTLSGIAARSDSSVRDLIFFNCISNPKLLTAGAVLFVPRTPDPANFSNDNGNDNDDDWSNDNDNGNDNDDDWSNDNDEDDGNDNRDDRSNDNDDDHDDRSNDNNRDDEDDDDDDDDDDD